MPVIEVLIMVVCALGAVVAGVSFLDRRQRSGSTMAQLGPSGPSFLFHDVDLEHATDQAEAMLRRDGTETDWQALRAGLLARFPGLPDVAALPSVGQLTLPAKSPNDPAVLHLSREENMTRVVIEDQTDVDPGDVHTARLQEIELETLRMAANDAPYPIWLLDPDQTVVWHNDAYGSLAAAVSSHGAGPDDPIFEFTPGDLNGQKSVRVPITLQNQNTTEWYNVTATQSGDKTIYHAIDINAVIQAEVAQRNFVQTLAKTFAQLSIGLAIFDRNGQLALFNPALVDLTSLPAQFLSGRPDMLSFFDRLRDNRVMPEPKNYGSWRQEISEMITAASHGSYQETWTLDTGHTYRVSGRPHPDGAVAFLIEDITAEISLTRNFRAELELGQALMDTFEDALAVFSSAGVLTFCNAAYRTLWKQDPDNSFADVTIVDSIKVWQGQCAPDPAWGDMRDFVMKLGERAAWDAELTHNENGTLVAQMSPIASGATVFRFMQAAPQPAMVSDATN